MPWRFSNDAIWLLQAQKKGFSGPKLGVKMSEKNERNFSQDQIDAGKFVASKQMGSNQGATQAGLGGFGNQRKM